MGNLNGNQTFKLKLSDGSTQTITGLDNLTLFDKFKNTMVDSQNPTNNTIIPSQNVTSSTTQTSTSNVQDIFNKLNLNPTNNNTLNAVHIGDQSIIKFNGALDQTMREKLENSGFKIFTDKDKKYIYAMKEDSFMQKNGSGIQAGLATAGLGLGIANYLDSHKAMKKQSALMDEQISALKENREHLKNEWERVNNVRKKVNTAY